ncbi:mannose-6-phosphate isomerase, class I [uncultured Serinicoccus sp.]|uniref:mannose-6-phosphate isomerase, class I n=1 Tax=uncultured Serinicoccus sp. TaxID=735514 RepID=UPI002631465F|nr:mannose-6-phosphate isomerase, class I [uncultured Serinicoccus sp.]
MSGIVRIDGVVRDYAWGRPGGISAARGQEPGDGPEAELWLGAHPAAPSRVLTDHPGDPPWPDLAAWEDATGDTLPFLMKLLAAGAPLSLQAHPGLEQARAGFAREEAAGIPRDAPTRSFRDPHAKPEVLLAVEDGFDALCGFRPVAEVVDLLDRLEARVPADGWSRWRSLLAGAGAGAGSPAAGAGAALRWLLSGDEAVDRMVDALSGGRPTGLPEAEDDLVRLLARHHPGDPGIAVALMLNRVTLAAGEALWLPAGNIHAYLSGLGVEVMGPSDNVLRGGLTGKHVDVPELLEVLDFTPGPPPRLAPVDLAPAVRAYRPSTQETGAGVPWQLVEVTGPAEMAVGRAAVALVLKGEFTLRTGRHGDPDGGLTLARGEAGFVERPGRLQVQGSGALYLATTVS